uniref:TENS3 protein n=1 Tax=Echinostoma caproni TaxID=27848 RepID=A0A183AR95_9TREM
LIQIDRDIYRGTYGNLQSSLTEQPSVSSHHLPPPGAELSHVSNKISENADPLVQQPNRMQIHSTASLDVNYGDLEVYSSKTDEDQEQQATQLPLMVHTPDQVWGQNVDQTLDVPKWTYPPRDKLSVKSKDLISGASSVENQSLEPATVQRVAPSSQDDTTEASKITTRATDKAYESKTDRAQEQSQSSLPISVLTPLITEQPTSTTVLAAEDRPVNESEIISKLSPILKTTQLSFAMTGPPLYVENADDLKDRLSLPTMGKLSGEILTAPSLDTQSMITTDVPSPKHPDGKGPPLYYDETRDLMNGPTGPSLEELSSLIQSAPVCDSLRSEMILLGSYYVNSPSSEDRSLLSAHVSHEHSDGQAESTA